MPLAEVLSAGISRVHAEEVREGHAAFIVNDNLATFARRKLHGDVPCFRDTPPAAESRLVTPSHKPLVSVPAWMMGLTIRLYPQASDTP
jgi:hypothetical protein